MISINTTLKSLYETNTPTYGYELEILVQQGLKSKSQIEARIARDLHEVYFEDSNHKPMKFGYYTIGKHKDRQCYDSYKLYRNFKLSPKASEFYSCNNEYENLSGYSELFAIRNLLISRDWISGKLLKRAVEDAIYLKENFEIYREKLEECEAFANLQYQIANYIKEYYIECENAISDHKTYNIYMKEYGTATVYKCLEI